MASRRLRTIMMVVTTCACATARGRSLLPKACHAMGPYDSSPPDVGNTTLVLIKVPKCASTTAAGVVRRIGSHHGHGGVRNKSEPTGGRKWPAVWASHAEAQKVVAKLREAPCLRWRPFLFTLLRDPLARATSEYFHFHVTREHANASDAAVTRYLDGRRARNFMFHYVRLSANATVERTLDVYDLVGTAELFDETMVLLAARLGVPLGDVLYVTSKNASAGGLDDIGHEFAAVGAAQAARLAAWARETGYEARMKEDYTLWRGATERVKAAIAPLRERLDEYRRLKAFAADVCAKDPQNFIESECLWRDSGCAFRCLDERAAAFRPDHENFLSDPKPKSFSVSIPKST